MMKRRPLTVLYALWALSFAFALGACGPATTATPEPTAVPAGEESPAPPATDVKPEEPVTLRVGIMIEPDCLHPWMCTYHFLFVDYMYEGFVGIGPDCEAVPRLAQSIEISEDGLTRTIHLQPGVTYSDGEPMNATTVKAFWDWWNSTSLKEWFPETLYTESSEAVGESTFQFTTSAPIGTFEDYSGTWIWPLPPHIWGGLDDETIFTFENTNPIGTGPYVLTEWQPGKHLIYDARDDYWGGKPPIDRVIMQVYTNWDSLLQALIAGEIDATDVMMPAQYYETVAGKPNITIFEQAPNYDYALVFNMKEGGSKNPAIDDPAVREAIDHAIDRRQAIEVAMLGHGVECPNTWWCGKLSEKSIDPSIEVTTYDLEEANRILQDAGYKDSDGDGVREGKDGEPLELRLYYVAQDPALGTIAGMVKDSLAQVGITVVVEAQEEGTLTDLMLGARDFDMGLYVGVFEHSPGALDFYFSCWTAEAGLGTQNWSGYCSPEMDEVIYGVVSTIGAEGQLALARQASLILSRDRPVLTVAGISFLQAYRSDRFTFIDNACPGMGGIWDWYSMMHAEVVK